MKLQEALKKLEILSKANLAAEQKKIIGEILKKAPEKVRGEWFKLLIQKVKLGFTFDSVPTVDHQTVALIREKEEKSINTSHYKNFSFLTNKLIVGENYDALKNLNLVYQGKVDFIYIDPPYNTEAALSDNNFSSSHNLQKNKFIYRDKFARTGWLNLLSERLKLAHQLLSDQEGGGIIFLSIDDNEQAYLKVLMDEIFGEENFISCLPRRTKSSGAIKTNFLKKEHDYLLIYVKNINNWKGFLQKNSSEKNYPDQDERFGKYISRPLDNHGLMSSKKNSFVFNYQGKKFYPGGKELYVSKEGKNQWSWRWNQTEIERGLRLGHIFAKKSKTNYLRLYQKYYFSYQYDKKTGKITSYQRQKNYSTLSLLNGDFANAHGKSDLQKILGNDDFSFPKPVQLIKALLKLVPNKKKMLILDFFAGSGTTGQAVIEFNQENSTNHQFILVTNNENDIAWKFCYPRIAKASGSDLPLQVFELEYHQIGLNNLFPNHLTTLAQNQLQKFSSTFTFSSEKDLYYKLTALHPEKNAIN